MLPPTAPGVGGGTVPVVRVTPDGADVAALERRLASAYRRAQLENDAQPWDDRGWLLAWPAAVLALFWFRQGWTMRWGLALCVSVFAAGPAPARAADVVGWFLTPDQQGRLAFEQRDFARAAERFVDPGWRAYALYRSGRYEEAARLWSAMDSAEAAVAQGMALIRSRHYRDAVRAFETALARDPEDRAAAHNLAVARRIVDYVESTREQSDTGEESGIGADDVVFDNESRRGVESRRTDQEPSAMLTAEQWMNTVDTRTADFLRQRFAMEAAPP